MSFLPLSKLLTARSSANWPKLAS